MNLSRRDQALLAFLVVILIGFAFYRRLYLPISQEIQTLAESNQQLQMEKERLQAEGKKGSAKTKENEDKFAHLDKRLPTQDEMIPLLTMLNDTIGKHGLPFTSLDYEEAEKPSETGAQTLIFNIATKGKIMQLLDFLNELENAERLISVEEVSFSGVKAEKPETNGEEEQGPPIYYIAPAEVSEAKLQRIKFEVADEKETPTDSEELVADGFTPDNFEMKITIKAYYAGNDKAARVQDTEEKVPNNKQI